MQTRMSKVQRILQENSKTIETMALQDHSCAQITAMWFNNFCKCNLQSAEDGELPSKLVFFSGFIWMDSWTHKTDYGIQKFHFIHMMLTLTSWCEVGAWYAGTQGLWVPFYADKINS